MLLLGPIDGRHMPTRARDWPEVLVSIWSVPYFAAGAQGRQEAGESSLGGKVCALSEMVAHVLLLNVFSEACGGVNPGMAGSEDCESLIAH